MVLAVAQTQVSGIWVAAAIPNASTHKVTIYLNKATIAKLTVAWFVI